MEIMAEHVMDGDLFGIASPVNPTVITGLIEVTAVAWCGDGKVQIFGYDLFEGKHAALNPIPNHTPVHLWKARAF